MGLPRGNAAPGFVPYRLNQSFWSDDAVKRRWFCLPETNQLFSVSIHDAWSAPPGAVWVKHFDIDTVVGDPGSRRRLETRLLERNARGVYGVTYRWVGMDSATLVPEEGAEELLVRRRVGNPNPQSFTQKWRYPSRTECLVCHTPQAGYSLGFKTSQLNCEADLGGTRTNQLLALAAAGYLDIPLPRPRDLPALAAPTDTRYSLEWRARIHIRQPANRRLQIELSPFLEVSSWHPLELPESVVDYPAEPRDVVVEYPLGDDSLFFRVQSHAP